MLFPEGTVTLLFTEGVVLLLFPAVLFEAVVFPVEPAVPTPLPDE